MEHFKHDKYIWWGVVGLGVAVLLWWLTTKQIKGQTVNTPYLVPQALNSNGPATDSSSTLPNNAPAPNNADTRYGFEPWLTGNSGQKPDQQFSFEPWLMPNGADRNLSEQASIIGGSQQSHGTTSLSEQTNIIGAS